MVAPLAAIFILVILIQAGRGLPRSRSRGKPCYWRVEKCGRWAGGLGTKSVGIENTMKSKWGTSSVPHFASH